MRTVQLFFFILILNTGYAQTDNRYSIGHVDSLHSTILGEDRQLLVYLPDEYDTSKQYPVVYLLDGESFFHSFTGIVSYLSGSYVIPEMIVIGIVNTNRGRDFTPTVDTTTHPRPNGGGEQFISFMEKELMPYMERRYSAAPYRLLVGHSLGGLLAAQALLHHTRLFQAYLLLDPSMWWDTMKLNKDAPALLKKTYPSGITAYPVDLDGKTVYLAMSNSMPAELKDTTQAKKDTTNGTLALRSLFLFRDVLSAKAPNTLRWTSHYYEQESHGSLPLISSYDALRFIFDFYKRPSLAVLTDETPAILENHYKMVSQKMGYTILPPESDLAGLAWRSKVLENNRDRALVFLKMYVRLYPDSQRANWELGQHYQEEGDAEKAKPYLEKAEQLQ